MPFICCPVRPAQGLCGCVTYHSLFGICPQSLQRRVAARRRACATSTTQPRRYSVLARVTIFCARSSPFALPPPRWPHLAWHVHIDVVLPVACSLCSPVPPPSWRGRSCAIGGSSALARDPAARGRIPHGVVAGASLPARHDCQAERRELRIGATRRVARPSMRLAAAACDAARDGEPGRHRSARAHGRRGCGRMCSGRRRIGQQRLGRHGRLGRRWGRRLRGWSHDASSRAEGRVVGRLALHEADDEQDDGLHAS